MKASRFKYAQAMIFSLGLAAGIAASALEPGAENERPGSATPASPPSKIRSPEDGWLDISEFIDQSYGFVPLVIPITEPAVGYGAAGALLFIDKPKGEAAAGFGRPNLTVVGGLRTENGTNGYMAGDIRHWLDDRLKTVVGIIDASVNLDFYGIGRDGALQDRPLTYNLKPRAGVAQATYRLGNSKTWAGFGYARATTTIAFNAPVTTPGLPEFKRESRVGGVLPSINYDSRDNIFTPTDGSYLEASAGLFSKALGGDAAFQRVNLLGIQYLRPDPKWTLGLRGSAALSFGEVPFYMRPFVMMRGVPAMRYMGEHVAQIEAEVRWQFWQRFSLVGFAGAGRAWNDLRGLDSVQNVSAGGLGLRYELARKYGMHMGLDIAGGPNGGAIYVQFGSAWMRP
jgi:hypothetical protein